MDADLQNYLDAKFELVTLSLENTKEILETRLDHVEEDLDANSILLHGNGNKGLKTKVNILWVFGWIFGKWGFGIMAGLILLLVKAVFLHS